MTKSQLADEFEFESQINREENPDLFEELETLNEEEHGN